MSLVPQSRDETHGNDAPRRFTNPEGVEFGLAPSWYRRGSTPSASIGNFVGVRGFHPATAGLMMLFPCGEPWSSMAGQGR